MTKLKNVRVLDTGLVGPASLGVHLAQSAGRKDCPIVDAVVLGRFDDGVMAIRWSDMSNQELAELSLTFSAIVAERILEGAED